MSQLLYTAIAFFVILISAAGAYLYLTGRNRGAKGIKEYFKPVFHKKYSILAGAACIVSFAVYAFSYFVTKETFLMSVMHAIVMTWLIVVGFIDLREKIIPNSIILGGIIFWVCLSLLEIFTAQTPIKQVLLFSLAGAGLCGGILFIVALIVKSALGMGDVKLFFVIGLLYGVTDSYSILLFSIVVMAVVSIVLLIAKKVTRKTAIPMAPFVAIGFLVNILMGM